MRTGAPIDRGVIVTTALRLVDEHGLDGLTLRRLAAELGVQAPALYWHVHNKRELLDAMAEELASALLPDALHEPAAGQLWWEWLTERARALRQAMLARRDGALVMVGNRPTPAALPGIERSATALVRAGLTPLEALRALQAVSAYAIGWVAEEQAEQRRVQQGPAAQVAESDRILVAAMTDATHFPMIAAAAQGMAGPADGPEPADGDTEGAFEFGLTMMVDGLRARAGRARPDGDPATGRAR